MHFVSFNSAADVHYDPSWLVEGTVSASQSPNLQKITIDGQTKYILKSDWAKYSGITDAGLEKIGNTWYNKDDLKSAEQLAFEAGNGKIHYYYTLSKTANNKWTDDQITEETNKLEWILPKDQAEFWFDRTKSDSLSTFENKWKYNNDGTANGQGVWRVKEILPDSTEDTIWLDEKDATKNKFLPKVKGDPKTTIPSNVYKTPEELLLAMGGYIKVDDNRWRRTDKIEYMQVTIDGETHYLPKNIALFEGDDLVPENTDGIIPVKYYNSTGDEKTGCAQINDAAEKYYKVCQDNYDGTPSTNNPVFVDELGNVQYRHKKDANGNEIATNPDGSVAYETIDATVDPYTDPALFHRAVEETIKEMIADLPEDERAELEGKSEEEKIAYLMESDSETYNSEVARFFKQDFPYLIDDNVKFFDKDKFNLASSVFDSFQLVKLTEYSYLNAKGQKRSINNLFTNADAIRSD